MTTKYLVQPTKYGSVGLLLEKEAFLKYQEVLEEAVHASIDYNDKLTFSEDLIYEIKLLTEDFIKRAKTQELLEND